MITIKDVAKEAGVSVATISRVLNNSPGVSDETRKMVLSVIKRLNYNPNLLGRNLRRMETKMILVLLPTISNPFYARIVKGIEDVAQKNGYGVMLCNTDSDVKRERMYLELLKNRLSDGVIFMAPEIDEGELNEIGEKFAAVQCCEYKEGANVSHVSIDNFKAAYKAVKHLIGLGHKDIGLISCKNNFLSTKQREEGYKKALIDFGIEFNPQYVRYGDYSFKSGFRATKSLLADADKITAIFAISDIMAIGAIKAANENGLKIPDDIAIVGFDNISFAPMYNPSLTTISQPKYDIGCTAMELLIKQIKERGDNKENIILEHELIIRESTVK
ncbi:LacI family DNA-binding transcriptional regulator [Thermoanaerobacterium sp. RBIITD]|uniref:LacI family DNA-binding transcriptional regulator n=1 Tax=Thermoanaerobacterium sp. RBIITD TaxID=1550240 RepID=UPI000BB6C7AF|nr:LacI family DNA-binding transcriptional regulator [Thermoanaerobacterium sp. RBIITD]SNX54624.1 transcriptional regulator, LacI family [Thermoanaerobacterium sp. RBIITD]